MLFLIVVYLWDLLIILTTTIAGQQSIPSQTFDITIGNKEYSKIVMIDSFVFFVFCRWCFYRSRRRHGKSKYGKHI